MHFEERDLLENHAGSILGLQPVFRPNLRSLKSRQYINYYTASGQHF